MNHMKKVVLITGASAGMGKETAALLVKNGYTVYGAARRADKMKDLEKLGVKILEMDVTDDESVVKGVNQIISSEKQIDILVNNAGTDGKNADFWDITEEDYDAVLNLNLKGVFFATQTLVQHLLETKRKGKIVNISSVHEELPFPHFTSYCASKGGVKMMMRNLAIELGPLGININNVAPGAIETPINKNLLNDPQKLAALLQNIPLGRLGKPSDIAPLVAFLASSDADYITGATFFADGGLLWNYHEQ